MLNVKTKLIIGCLISASFFMACSQEVKEETSEKEVKIESKKQEPIKKKWAPEDMNSSELALLMRAMWDSSMFRKEQIISGENVNAYADLFNNIHTANATSPDEITDMFHGFADVFQQNMKQVDAAETNEGKTLAFNNMVTTCVSCHQQYCQGPIPKIKKLYIKE